MLKLKLEEDLKEAIKDLGFIPPDDTVLTISQHSKFGDYTSNIPLQLAKQEHKNSYQNPVEIANAILGSLGHPPYLERVEVAGAGFLNFFVKNNFLVKDLKEILDQAENFGKNNKGQDKKIQVEFISANPTGPLTLANGRGGAIGDSLAWIFEHSGYQVEREYYVNDTGNQIKILGESVLAAAGKLETQDYHYQGDYVKRLAEIFKDNLDLNPMDLGHLLADYLIDKEIKPSIVKLGIKFDEFYSERSLYPDKINHALEVLDQKGATYEKDGAIWFKSTQFGDEKDRVLMTSDMERGKKEPTYFLADIAHHISVLDRGYTFRVNILGADHHSYAQRILGSMAAVGFHDRLRIVLMQLVKLYKSGVEVKMSKRAGNFITLDELLEEVSADVCRYFFLMFAPNTHINFNLDLAKEQSEKNPVYYVQYAHARMNNILEKAGSFEEAELDQLVEEQELELIKHLLEFPDLVKKISEDLQVHNLTAYSHRLADLFHSFYEKCPVLTAPENLKESRLALVKAAKIVLGSSLSLLGVSAPKRM